MYFNSTANSSFAWNNYLTTRLHDEIAVMSDACLSFSPNTFYFSILHFCITILVEEHWWCPTAISCCFETINIINGQQGRSRMYCAKESRPQIGIEFNSSCHVAGSRSIERKNRRWGVICSIFIWKSVLIALRKKKISNLYWRIPVRVGVTVISLALLPANRLFGAIPTLMSISGNIG